MVARPVIDPVAQKLFFVETERVGAMDHEPVELGKRAFVDQRLDALARRELSPRVLSRERLASRGNLDSARFTSSSAYLSARLFTFATFCEALGTPSENNGLMLRVSCCIFALAVVGPIPAGFPSPPPIPPQRAVAESIYGTSVTDPYRYFEHGGPRRGAVLQGAERLRARRARQARRTARTALRAHQTARQRRRRVTGVTRDGAYYFYEKLNPGDNGPKLFVRNVDGRGERALVDPQTLATPGKHYTINYFLPSLDGRYVAYGSPKVAPRPR